MARQHRCLDRLRALMGYRFPRLGRRAFKAFFHCLPSRLEVELFPGLHVDLDFHDATQRTTYWQGARYEHPAARILASWIREETVFFDIGANYGFFSYWMLSRKQPITVHAFDPLPENVTIMERARLRNGLQQRFHITACALGDTTATMDLRTGGNDSGLSTLGPHPGLKGKTLPVPVLPFDAWLRQAGVRLPPVPTWIAKIDVEGFEYHVLRGMNSALQAQAFAGLMIEINPYTLGLCGHSAKEVFSYLEQAGYQATGKRVKPECQRPGEWCNAFFIPAS